MPPRNTKKGSKPIDTGNRLLRAQVLLGRASGVTIEELADELHVERAAATSYIAQLEQSGFVVDTIGKRGRSKLRRISSSPVTVAFTFEEAAWVMMMTRYVSAYENTGIHEALRRVSAKVEAKLKPDDRKAVAALDKKFFTVPDHAHDYSGKRPVIDEMARALGADRPVMMTQTSRRTGETRAIRFEPYALITYKRALHVVGKTHAHKGEIRTFSVDGIEAAEMVKDAFFVRPDDFDPAKYFEGSFGLFRGEETKVVLRFDESVEPWLRPRKWHPTQVLESRDGYVWLTLRPRGTTELLSWILSWGDKVCVIEPKDLRDAWIGQLEQALRAAREVDAK